MDNAVRPIKTAPRILIDIDGAEISFACADSQEPTRLVNVRKYRTSDFPTATDCIMGYARDVGIQLAGSNCIIVVTGAVIGDAVRIARCPWIVSISGFKYLFQTTPLVINDCAAQLWAATRVSPQTHRALGAFSFPDFSRGGKWLAINYSEGLGAAILVPNARGGFIPVDSEIGHCAFAPTDEIEKQLHENLSRKKRPVSWEMALTADSIDECWKDTPVTGNLPNLRRKRCEVLGSFVGDAVLATAAWDGVFLFKRAAELMSSSENHSLFTTKMTARANFQQQLRRAPVWSVTINNGNLSGAAIYLDQILDNADVL